MKRIETVSFARSEATNLAKTLTEKEHEALGKDDVVLFVSKGGGQLVFVWGWENFEMDGRPEREVLRSERLRLKRGTWNPLLLANYAEEVGIKLDGLKRFEEHYARARGERARVKNG